MLHVIERLYGHCMDWNWIGFGSDFTNFYVVVLILQMMLSDT